MRRILAQIIALLIGVLIFSVIDCSGNRKKEKRLIEFWGQETYDFFKNNDCDKFPYNEYEFDINGIFIIKGHFKSCELFEKSSWELNFKEFISSSSLAKYYVNDINKANTLIWLDFVGNGEEYGNYTNGAIAKRRVIEVNFIDIKNKTIFKKKEFNCIGEPPFEILRKRGENHPEFFGNIPYKEVIDFIINTIEK